MNLKQIDQTGWLIIAAVGIIVVYEIATNLETQPNGSPSALGAALGVPDPNDTTGDPNSAGDTSSAAYAGYGILGWLGNIFNKASGGVLQSAGNAIGGGVYSATSGC